MAEPAEKDDEISVFDTANYVNQMAGELSRMARNGGLNDLADTLAQAQMMAAAAMVQPPRSKP